MFTSGPGAAIFGTPEPVEPGDVLVEDDEVGRAGTTFGFEAEYQRNAEPLARKLYGLDLTVEPTIHGWHCDCDGCGGYDFPLSVQRDSTVDGEVVSRPFDDWREANDVMTLLQQAAVDADAEPGFDAGLHIHVARPDTPAERRRAFAAYLRWEPALEVLAQGRFPYLRSMNTPVRATVQDRLACTGMRLPEADARVRDLLTQYRTEHDPEADNTNSLYGLHYSADRHSHLNVNTRFRTWEWRIWNSTRSAWRIEMACRFAQAWTDPAFVARLLEWDGAEDTAELVEMADTTGHSHTAELLQRQLDYASRTDKPSAFLVA